MLIRFTDDYDSSVAVGYDAIGKMQMNLATLEPWMGLSPNLDKIYAISILTAGIIEYLNYTDNSDAAETENFLQCLKSLNKAEYCGKGTGEPLLDLKDYHNIYPFPIPEVVMNINSY